MRESYEFTCANCHRTLDGFRDEAAEETEFKRIYGLSRAQCPEPLVDICDDCYQDFLAFREQLEVRH